MKRRLLIVLLAVLGLVLPLSAQRRGSGNSQASRAEMERRVRESYDRLVRDRLGLSEQQLEALNEAVLPFQEERLTIQRRETELRRRLEGQSTSNRRVPLMPEAQAREVVQEMRALQVAETDLFNREQERLQQLLTPGQMVAYYMIREQLAEALRRARGGRG